MYSEKDQKLLNINREIEEKRNKSLLEIEKIFHDKKGLLLKEMKEKSVEAMSDIENISNNFQDNKSSSVIDLASFIIEKITNKSVDKKLITKLSKGK